MRAIRFRQPGGLERLELVELSDPGEPRAGEIRVRVHASSLNYHDLNVVQGQMRALDGRIAMSDGAGMVEAVGAGVTEFAPGDHVVSTFFPQWLDGGPTIGDFTSVPGDGVDGFACEVVVRRETAFTH